MKDFFKSFIMSEGKIQPIYFWATMFLIPVVILLNLKVAEIIYNFFKTGTLSVPVPLLSIVLGYVLAWTGMYNLDKWKKRRYSDINIGDVPEDFGGK